MSPLLVRADANAQIGAGHVMRCLALAQEWQRRGGEVTFALADGGAGTILDRLRNEGVRVVSIQAAPGSNGDARKTAHLAQSAGRLVLDGYGFGARYQRRVAEAGTPFLILDDYGHAEHYYADLLLNQNIAARAELYPSVEPHTELLLGTRFAMLRREFRQAAFGPPAVPPHRILVTLGGGDAHNVTAKVIEALRLLQREDLHVTVLAGTNNTRYDSIASRLGDVPFKASLLRSVDDMPSLISEVDFVVSAGGSTCWELAFMGRPNLVISIADNQSDIAEGLDSAGVSVYAGWWEGVSAAAMAASLQDLLSDAARLASMAVRGRCLVDGEGVSRVVDAMLLAARRDSGAKVTRGPLQRSRS